MVGLQIEVQKKARKYFYLQAYGCGVLPPKSLVEFDAHKKTNQQESYLGYGLTE
jgi:hypothetical protein